MINLKLLEKNTNKLEVKINAVKFILSKNMSHISRQGKKIPMNFRTKIAMIAKQGTLTGSEIAKVFNISPLSVHHIKEEFGLVKRHSS
jgi:hypothetical protein